jgi:hypothetical protein
VQRARRLQQARRRQRLITGSRPGRISGVRPSSPICCSYAGETRRKHERSQAHRRASACAALSTLACLGPRQRSVPRGRPSMAGTCHIAGASWDARSVRGGCAVAGDVESRLLGQRRAGCARGMPLPIRTACSSSFWPARSSVAVRPIAGV